MLQWYTLATNVIYIGCTSIYKQQKDFCKNSGLNVLEVIVNGIAKIYGQTKSKKGSLLTFHKTIQYLNSLSSNKYLINCLSLV